MGNERSVKLERLIRFLLNLCIVALILMLVAMLGFFIYAQYLYFGKGSWQLLSEAIKKLNIPLANPDIFFRRSVTQFLFSLTILLATVDCAISLRIVLVLKDIFKRFCQNLLISKASLMTIWRPQIWLLVVSLLMLLVGLLTGNLEFRIDALFAQVALLTLTYVVVHRQD
ncbi:hypothetical protein [Lapidilactobacillus wuchangensis]|uniref:hypothetical protein n=1 Tax=Lapidilactobacillus wuchangensis TaxID=2486001 RepID=UPI000F7B6FCC|nr:hypothetical protein [Lapidilactobacillus wuchangensis]